jgi:AcrR family transcriptional regulator
MTDQNQDQYRTRILEAAKVLFARYGFRKTTVDEIAEWAGMSKSTMYKVFPTKEKILAELIVWEARAFRRAYTAEIKKLEDPLEKMRILCLETSDYFNRFPFLGRVMTDEERRFEPFLQQEVSFVEDGISQMIADLLEEGIQAGVVRNLNVADTTKSILVLMRAFAYHQTPSEIENSEWINLVLEGIKKK